MPYRPQILSQMTTTRPESVFNSRVLIVLALVAGLVYTLSAILMPFVLGILLAYVCHPLAQRLLRRGWPPALAALLVMLILGVIVGAFGVLVLPMLYHELNMLTAKLPALINELLASSSPVLQQSLGIDLTTNLDQLRAMLLQNIGVTEAALQKIMRSAGEGGAWILGLLLSLLLVPVVLFYLLKDWTALLSTLKNATPSQYRPALEAFARDIDAVLGQFLRGQLLVMAVMATYYGAGLHLVGLHSGLALGIVTGLLVFIPYVGVFSGFILSLLAALMQGPGLDPVWPVLAVFLLGHVLEGTLVTPRLVGERIGLHPVMVIFALMAFGTLLGFFGVVIALPASAVLRVTLSRLRDALARDGGAA